MIRSMSAAVTGLRGHQLKLDVIGNNIANINTTGFKKSQARFEDLLSQTLQGATGPLDRGGINPSQVGLGMRVSTIVDIHIQGAITTTDRETDLAIEGAGFFAVSDGEREFYTRDGSFGLDSAGNLVNNNGLFVLDVNDENTIENRVINIPLGDDRIARASTMQRFAGNLDTRVNTSYSFSLGNPTDGNYEITVEANGGTDTFSFAFNATSDDIVAALEGQVVNGVTLSSVAVTGLGTVANPFVLTINQTDPTGSEVRITNFAGDVDFNGSINWGPASYVYEYYAYDSQGIRYSIDYAFTKTGQNRWDYFVNVFDEDNNQLPISNGAIGTIVFNTAGLVDQTQTNIVPLEFSPTGVDPLSIMLDFDNLTQLADVNSLVVREQDGYSAGTLATFSIGRTGIVTGIYTNGLVQDFGQIGVVSFFNPEGLIKEGGNLFVATTNSGDPVTDSPGVGGRGLISSSSLELSNTDLAYEFTELITTSRGFQANTRVITTSDEILVEVVNMKR